MVKFMIFYLKVLIFSDYCYRYMSTNRLSKTPLASKKKLFLTENDSQIFESTNAKKSLEPPDGKQDLTVLKRNYDSVKQENIKKSKQLTLIQAQVLEVKSTASNITDEMQKTKDQVLQFNSSITKAKDQLSEELELKRVYEHILSRNKQVGTQLDIKVNKYSENLKSAKFKLDFELAKARKAKDSKFSAKSMLKDLKINLEEDTKKHVNYISSLEKNIEKRRDLIRKYDDRTKRQRDIVELAVKFDRDNHEGETRERINLCKILFDLMVEKEKKYHKAGKEVENAFKDIRNKTGITDPKEILAVFMNRENTHNRLIEEVEKAETRLDVLQDEYYRARDRLKNLMVVTDFNPEKEDQTEQTQVTEAYKKLSRAKTQQSKTELVYKDIKKWCKKVKHFLNIPSPSEEIYQNMLTLQSSIDSLVHDAQSNPSSFHLSVVQHQKRRTSDLVKQLNESSSSPSQVKTRKVTQKL